MISGRAKTKEQKEKILAEFLKLWLEWPELRFSQLIKNAYHDSIEMYNVEDDQFVYNLRCYYNQVKEKNETSKS